MDKNRWFTKQLDLQNKLDEIEFLDALKGAIPADTYLADLFTQNMVMELQSRIRNDFPCDILGDMEYKQGELDKQAMSLKEALQMRDDERTRLRTVEAATVVALNDLAERLSDMRDNNAELRETVSGLSQEITKWQSHVEIKEMEILKLKAQIYDLQN